MKTIELKAAGRYLHAALCEPAFAVSYKTANMVYKESVRC